VPGIVRPVGLTKNTGVATDVRALRGVRPWIVIVEPGNDASLLIVVTAYGVFE
jgi:hypothetical protein